MRLNNNIKGAALMTGCGSAYVINDALMKLLFSEISLFQALFLRSMIIVPPVVIIAWFAKIAIGNLSNYNKRLVLLRVGAEVCATIAFLIALKHMPLVNVTAILQALPLAITMAAALFLSEPVGWRRWIAILIGFIGVLIIVRPSVNDFNIYSLSAIVALILITVRDVFTRKLTSKVPTITVAVATVIGIGVFSGIMMIGTEWHPVNASSWPLILGAGVAVLIGTFLSVMAMQTGEISFVSTFRYTAMLVAIGVGILIFDDWPDQLTLIGTVTIVVTGVYSFYRERGLNRKLTN